VALRPGGREVELEKLNEAERRAHDERFGKLDPALVERLERGGDKVLPVLIWLSQGETEAWRPPSDARLSTEDVDRALARIDAIRAKQVGELAEPVVRDLRALGVEAVAAPGLPVVQAVVPVELLSEVSALSTIDTVYLDNESNEPELDVAVPVVDLPSVHGAGFRGNGVQVGVVEVGGRAAANPFLSVEVQDPATACAAASSHSTAVAGLIRANPGFAWPFAWSNLTGAAPSARLRVGGSCGGVDSELQARSTDAANWGARILNLSWGGNTNLALGANDRFYDDMVMNRARTVVKSAGNRAGACAGDGNVTSPGLAYNVITVGNVDTRRTVSHADDVMGACSSFGDPTSTVGDREKPELAAPGENMNSTTTGIPWTGAVGSGTSFAAPIVSGTAAVLVQRNPVLGVWPERLKAILMASAVHNVEGSARLSESDGAGMISAGRADEVASGANGANGGRFYSCANEPQLLNLSSVQVAAGTRVRAVIAWDANTADAQYANRPSADLDLRVVGPAGTTFSSSWDNTYEIVDFTAPATGAYTIQVNKYRCDMSTWLGYALRTGN
jgi:subtilisin family serine protease